MTYTEWFETHGKKHQNIMKRLKHLSDVEVLEYFRFENMVQKEKDFCYLYEDNKKCHDMKTLNCYLCACPYFKFDDEGLAQQENKTVYSICSIDAKEGKAFVSEHAIHQDCSACEVPHKESYIKKHFSRDWFEMMSNVKVKKV